MGITDVTTEERVDEAPSDATKQTEKDQRADVGFFEAKMEVSDRETDEDDSDDDENVPEATKTYLRNFYDPKNFPEDFGEWSPERHTAWINEKLSPFYDEGPPIEVVRLRSGLIRPGDCGRSPMDRPDWLDMEKFRRGQKFLLDNFNGLTFAIELGILCLYTFTEGIKPILITRRSETPYASFRRYLTNVYSVWIWATKDPWEEGSEAFEFTRYVRKQHQSFARLIEHLDSEEIDQAAKIPNAFCPMRNKLLRDFKDHFPKNSPLASPFSYVKNSPYRPKSFNQAEMYGVLAGFVYLPILYPKHFGCHDATDEDLDAYCFFWRGIGYLLGAEDEYNYCNGTFEDVKKRSKDVIEESIKMNFRRITPEWEHVARSMVKGVSFYFLDTTFEGTILYLARVLQVPMPRLKASLSHHARFMYFILILLMEYLSRITFLKRLSNKFLIYCVLWGRNLPKEKLAKIKKVSEASPLHTNNPPPRRRVQAA